MGIAKITPISFWVARYTFGNEVGEAIRCENCKRWVPRYKILLKKEDDDEDMEMFKGYAMDTYGELPPSDLQSGVPSCGPCVECDGPDFIGARLKEELKRDVLYIEGVTPSDDPDIP